MKQNTINRFFIFLVAGGVAVAGSFFALRVDRARAEDASSTVIMSDATKGYGFAAYSAGCYGGADGIFGCALSPMFDHYSASSSFSISKITFNWGNGGANNCDGVGNYGAIITGSNTTSSIIATSTNTVYLGCAGWGNGTTYGTHGSGELDFTGQTIPANFYLTFGAFDSSLQGGSEVGVGNVVIYGSFISSSTREPVIIVPGIMGSRLNATGTGDEVWPNVSAMVASPSDNYLDVLKIDSAVYPSNIIREATGTFLGIPVRSTFYGGLINALVSDGYVEGKNLFVFPYDWRHDVSREGDAFAAAMAAARAASPDGKINIIAHSMGGLLVKKVLSGMPDTSFVDKLVLAGVPELGAPKDFSVLNYGDDLGLSWLGIFGLNAQKVKDISQNMPSVYQLLPSQRYTTVAGPYVHDFEHGGSQFLDYGQTNAFMTRDPNDSRDPALLTAADSFHQALDGHPVNAAHVYNILGCSKPTITGFNVYDNGSMDVVRGNGDGVVPALSTMDAADGYANYFVLGDQTGIDHQGLVSDSRPLALIERIIDAASSTIAPGEVPAGISTASVDCFDPGSSSAETAYEFSTHSPVSLDVYDATNRHTGPTADGTFELGIPGSEYEKIGENAFVVVPVSSTYKVITRAVSSTFTASSTFTLKVKSYKKSSVSRVATYPSVPIQNSSTKGELDFTGFDGSMNLQIDNNGTSTVIEPSSILSTPSSTTDSIPPVISLSGIPSSVPQGATTTVTFSATDNDSGVASLVATLNGLPITSGQMVTFTQLGTSTLRITAIDTAGNPSVVETHITVIAPVIIPPTSTSTVTTTTLPLSFDTYVARQMGNQNRGAAPFLRLRDEEWHSESLILLGVSSSSLASTLASKKIISAKLTLTIAKNHKDWGKKGNTLDLYRMITPWTELGATWHCPTDINIKNFKPDCKPGWNMDALSAALRPWASTSTASLVVTNNVSGTITFDVTNDVELFLSGAVPDYGWLLKKSKENESGLIDLYSRENIHSPRLTVTYQ